MNSGLETSNLYWYYMQIFSVKAEFWVMCILKGLKLCLVRKIFSNERSLYGCYQPTELISSRSLIFLIKNFFFLFQISIKISELYSQYLIFAILLVLKLKIKKIREKNVKKEKKNKLSFQHFQTNFTWFWSINGKSL